jgi:hypothetical protein
MAQPPSKQPDEQKQPRLAKVVKVIGVSIGVVLLIGIGMILFIFMICTSHH